MRSWLVGLALGVAVLQTRPTLLNITAAVLLLVCALALSALRVSLRTRPSIANDSAIAAGLRVLASLALGTVVGFSWATLFAQAYLRHELPRALEGADIILVGTVASLPGLSAQGTRFDFSIEQANGLDHRTVTVPPRVSLLWPAGMAGRAAPPVPDLQPGERWQLAARLTRPHGNANPDGFDYEVWLLEQNLRATGSVRTTAAAAPLNRRLTPFVFSFGNLVESTRAWLRARILNALPAKRFASVLVALVVGDQRGVQQADWTVFTRTGIGHLISISGLHVTMIAGLFARGGGALWRRSFFTDAQLPLYLPVQKFAALVGVGTALLYVLLAGFGVPAQRTLYMIGVVALALWWHRLTSVSHVLCLALGAVLVLDPWAVMSPGFWLSFGAVATILYASVGRTPAVAQQGRWGRFVSWLQPEAHTQYVVTIGLIPLTMLLFGQISLISPLANAVAIPLISFVVTPLALLGAVAPAPLAVWLLLAAHACVEALAAALTWLSALPSAVWSAPIPAGWMFAVAAIGTLWLLTPRGWPMRWAGIAGFVPMLCVAPTRPAEGEFDVLAFDIGQGMALLVETAHHRLLYDT
ncbi:MAG: ComEC/Rec2 family competence protein, partial [Pseudomonadota bacterium]|nr:ComEC/Rec2 family competence protein [Pseudomonadota bacterium]